MIATQAAETLTTLALALAEDESLRDALPSLWDGSGDPSNVSSELREAAEALDRTLPALTRSGQALDRLGPLLSDQRSDIFLAWIGAVVARPDVRLAPLLGLAKKSASHQRRADQILRRRVVEGPLVDALCAATHLGPGSEFSKPENEQPRARMDILVWAAGASALQVPEIGAWIFEQESTFDVFVAGPAAGSLRGRVLAARCLEIGAKG